MYSSLQQGEGIFSHVFAPEIVVILDHIQGYEGVRDYAGIDQGSSGASQLRIHINFDDLLSFSCFTHAYP